MYMNISYIYICHHLHTRTSKCVNIFTEIDCKGNSADTVVCNMPTTA